MQTMESKHTESSYKNIYKQIIANIKVEIRPLSFSKPKRESRRKTVSKAPLLAAKTLQRSHPNPSF